ncbi:complex I NDUFA9 subunit family protein [Lentisalinibacter salinarum]|uniref:complex I NDUFA9 subunit family protein n=1 Tax=Lentisalinibacter salinarum TaxID=2992239 RepID=UPI003868808A
MTQRICVLGGTGFVGTEIVERLAADQHRVLVPTRNVENGRHLKVLPTVTLVAADVHEPAALERLFQGQDTVINLVGILNESGHSGRGFDAAHRELTRKVVAACRAVGVGRLLQMSALKASPAGPSHYLRTKGEAEEIIERDSGDALAWTIFQPSVIFGPEDGFVNRFAGLLKFLPVLPLAMPDSRFAPVSVDDVAEAFALSLDDAETESRRFELCGPRSYTLRELVDLICATLEIRRLIIGLPEWASRLQARIFEYVPGKPLSWDNYLSLTVPSVCESDGFEHFDIRPRSIETAMPLYIGKAGRNARYSRYRREAGRITQR